MIIQIQESELAKYLLPEGMKAHKLYLREKARKARGRAAKLRFKGVLSSVMW